jgi:glycosyltransferase involved in cell wall biosynthesis
VSSSWAELFASKAENRYAVVENGFDPNDFESVQPAPADDFVLAHVGKLYASRNPTALWRALAQLRDEGRIPDLRVHLTGSVDPEVRRSIERHGLSPIVTIDGFVPHEEALRRMARSTLLLLVIEQFVQAKGMITSKLYEYLASGRPVLGVGPSGGDADTLLREHEAGAVVDWGDTDRMKEMIATHYEAWQDGTPRSGAAWADIQQHNRVQQARRLADELDAITPAAS